MRARYREIQRRGTAFLLVLVMAAGLLVPAAAAGSSQTAELIAAFDKTSYASGERVSVTFTLYGADFDAAGFHIDYSESGLTYSDVQAASGFSTPVCREQDGGLELLVQSERVQSPGRGGVRIATVTFTADTAGAKTLRFQSGSAAYLEGKDAVAYNGYQALDVTARVVEDLTAYNALAQAKADAVQELETYVEAAMADTTVAGQDMLRNALQSGTDNINGVKTEVKVRSALESAKKNVDRIIGYGEVRYPKLLKLYDGDVTGKLEPCANMYPVFDPETTTYFFYQSRAPQWTPRTITCVADENVDVTVDANSALGRPRDESTFTVTLSYTLKNNVHWVRLTDRVTGLSTTYTFYTFNAGVAETFTNLSVYKVQEQENAALDNALQSGQMYRASTDTPDVKIGFRAGIKANTEFCAELLGENGEVLQTFSAAAGDEGASRDFLSDTLHLRSGTNWVMLRVKGENSGSREDYAARVIVIRYISPEDYENEPALKDTTLEAVSLYYVDGGSDKKNEENVVKTPIPFDFDPETRRYSVTLPAEDFDTEKSSQEIRMRLTPRDGQQVTVYGGSGTPQNRSLLPGGYYHVAEYTSTEMTVRNQFDILITVTAPDGIHQDVYQITVSKDGKPGIVMPKAYQVREETISASKPIRGVNLVFDSVSITNENGDRIETAAAGKAGRLRIEIADPTVVSWDGKTQSGGTFPIDLLTQGKTDITLVYDDGAGTHLEAKSLLYVNYSVDMIPEVLKEADQIVSDEKLGVRAYEPGAVDALKNVIIDSRTTYSRYASQSRSDLTQTDFDRINSAVNDLRDAIMECRWRELGIKITAFDPLPEDEIPREVAYNTPPETIGPKSLGATTADGEHITIYGVTWTYTPEFTTPMYESKEHIFTAQLPSGYALARDVKLPTFTVLRQATPWMVYLTKNQVLFPEACTDFNRDKTTATLKVYPGTTLEEIFNQQNRDGRTGTPGLGLQSYARAPWRTSLPTEWLEVPNNFSSDIVGRSFTFRFTLQEGGRSGGINFKWNESVPDDQKIYTMTVKIVPPPTVTVKGLDNVDIDAVTVSGTKTDTVFGSAVESDLAPFTIRKSDGWTYKLTDRGEKLVPLKYDFTPQEIEGYEAKVSQTNNGDYVITYVETKPEAIHLEPSVLTLSIGDEAKVSLREILPDGAAYTWTSDKESVASVTPVDLRKSGKITALEAGTATITLEVTLNGEKLTAVCAVTVLSGSGGDGPGGDTPGGGDPGGDPGGEPGGDPGGEPGSTGGETGRLNGQPTTGGSDYKDLLTSPPQQSSTNTTTGTNASAARPAAKPKDTQTTTGAEAEESGDGSGGGAVSRVVSVSKGSGDSTPASKRDAAVILAMCGALLAAGVFRGRRRGED